jgi:hypothetical protein
VVLGVALILAGAAAWWGVERYAPAYHWQFVQVDVFSDLDLPLLRGYRSLLALIAMPVLALACLVTLVVALRRRSLSAIVVAGVTFLAANLGVLGPRHRVWSVAAQAAVALACVGILVSGWHSVSTSSARCRC